MLFIIKKTKNLNMRQFFLLFICMLFGLQIFAQNENKKKQEGNILLFAVNYKFQRAAGDFSNRFGPSSAVGFNTEILSKKNWIIGVESNLLFGTVVNEDVLASIRTPEGDIIGSDQSLASVALRLRGMYAGVNIGKLFRISSKYEKSGIRITLGSGFFQHKIRIQDDNVSVPQIAGEYFKGYDRLTNGLAFTQFIGYEHLSKNRLINFYAGFEILEGFTKNRRDFNFDTMMKDDRSRMDMLISFKMGWAFLNFYVNDQPDEIYY